MISHFSTLRSLLHYRSLTRDDIVAFQNRRLRVLVAHAYENVPYYRRLFDRTRLKPRDIRTVADLSAIPITSKKDLQGLPAEEVVARGVNPSKLVVRTTSGSTGEPFTVRRTRLEDRLLHGFRLRAWHDFGLRPMDRHATIVLTKNLTDGQLLPQIFHALGLYRKVRIDALSAPESITSMLRQTRPDIISGYAGVLSRVAQIMKREDRSVIRPRFVVTGVEVLTPLMRCQIREGFGTSVSQIYASIEFNTIARECKETGALHVCDDSLIVEVLKDGRPVASGDQGELVGTNLHSFAMPFIRYRLGDIVTKGPSACLCGQPFSTIYSVQGRMVDYFPLPEGRLIHPYEIVMTLYDKAPWIRQYQLTQEREDRIVLRVVPDSRPSSQDLTLLKQGVSARLGNGVEFVVSLVSEIALEPSGKFRVSRSLVSSAYDGLPDTTAVQPM